MRELKDKKSQKRYNNVMTKLARQGRVDDLIKVGNEYYQLLEINETTSCSTITRRMNENDSQKSNKLLQKMCICCDIAEGCLIDLESLLQRYDELVTLPLRVELDCMKKIARNILKIVDGGTNNSDYIAAFGDVADLIDSKIEEILK